MNKAKKYEGNGGSAAKAWEMLKNREGYISFE